MRDYIYATDIADAFLSIGISPLAGGEIFNCGFGWLIPFRAMTETVVRVLEKVPLNPSHGQRITKPAMCISDNVD
jgi:nucleoside-diphosphate-sugar epimerase